ncbi:MAG: VOC family protein [Bacteroidota bacterium]
MKLPLFRYVILSLLIVIIGGGVYVYNYAMARLAPRPSMLDSPTSFLGVNHIGISVLELDKMLEFYEEATDFEVIKRYKVENDETANALFGRDSIAYETAILKGPNMLLELTEFANQADSVTSKMPFYGPGMTHTCYQGPPSTDVYHAFKEAGADILSRGEGTVVLSSVSVSYAYGYDPEGNMMELEHMPDILIPLNIGKDWAKEHPMWMTQVALMSPDLKSLTEFYEKVLEIEPYRSNSYGPSPILDAVVDFDSVMIEAVWFGLDTQGKKMEMMQYTNPVTPAVKKTRKPTDLGYSFSFEVGDIQKEYERLTEKGVRFFSKPQQMEDFWMVLAQDPDGNNFSLRQIVDESSPLSLKNM